jgi:hypothetical protein
MNGPDYDWWRRAVDDPNLPRHDGEPQCGFYKRRYVKGGPWVAVRVFRDDAGIRATDANLEIFDPAPVWSYLRPISFEEYRALKKLHATDDRFRATHAPVDLKQPMRP